MQALYEAYKDKVQIFLVYVSEAHPVREGKQRGAQARTPREIAQTKSVRERALAATDCLLGLKLSLPVLLDTMDGAAEKAYGGHPAGTAVIDIDGRVCFHSRGPSGVRPKEAGQVFQRILANKGKLPGAAATGTEVKEDARPKPVTVKEPAPKPVAAASGKPAAE